MRTPRPYRESRRGSAILREFREDVHTEDLIWHQDKRDRRVTVVEGSGWRLQMQDGLPFALIEGNTYDIPARTWHRLIKGKGNLRVKILETDMRITESQLRQIIREEILGESIYSDRSFHAGSRPYRHEYFEAKDWEDVTRAFENVVGRTGNRRIMLTDLFKEMERMNPRDYPDLVERYLETGARAEDFLMPGFFNGTGLMLRDGAVQEVIEPIGEAKTQKKSYGKKEYKSSSGSVAAIKKHGGSAKKAVAAGAFNWASDPWAAANAAHIVAMGEPTVRKGEKRKK